MSEKDRIISDINNYIENQALKDTLRFTLVALLMMVNLLSLVFYESKMILMTIEALQKTRQIWNAG